MENEKRLCSFSFFSTHTHVYFKDLFYVPVSLALYCNTEFILKGVTYSYSLQIFLIIHVFDVPLMYSFAKLHTLSLSVLFYCSCDKVYLYYLTITTISFVFTRSECYLRIITLIYCIEMDYVLL